MNLFNTNFRTLVNSILPVQLRSTSLLDFFQALTAGLQTNINNSNANFSTIPTKVLFNGQHIVLRAAITFLVGVACDVVTNQSTVYKTFLWNEAEGFFDYIYNESESTTLTFFIWNESELSQAFLFDFNVKIYFEDATPEIIGQITGVVNQFKLSGKNFNITDDL